MKTLLLTFLVVTIVCLDLGYTLICHQVHGLQTCEPAQKFCQKRTTMFFPNHPVLLMGCTYNCPTERYSVCCSTDKCNK
uniref:Short neurotoxin SNTX26 n=1 Tax=Ophiophagus hannah TaxID=8665 RepID=3SXQ_OPHHA|nr:RecName: Full=Short neurotoxin SNTX26; AltName: Full=Three-finger toxin; Short=3FTx; Flags: Precursor [Ophiophagus hannah]ABB83630.1 short chain neurotoxin precursor [Ophiophagus hannah]